MNRIEDIKQRLDNLSKRGLEGYEAKEHFDVHSEADIEYVLSKLEIAEEALGRLDYVIKFDHKQETRPDEERMKQSKSGTEMEMWHQQIEFVKSLNWAKRFAKEALQQIRE